MALSRAVCSALAGLWSLPIFAEEQPPTLQSKVYQFEQLPVSKGKNMLIMQL